MVNFYFSSLNRLGLRRRGFRFDMYTGRYKTFFFKKKRLISSSVRTKALKRNKFKSYSSYRIREPKRYRFGSLIRYVGDSRFLSSRRFVRRRGFLNSYAMRTGFGDVFRTRRRRRTSFPYPFAGVYQRIRNYGYRYRSIFKRLRFFWFKRFKHFLPRRSLSLSYLRTISYYFSKTYLSNFRFFNRSVKRTSSSFRFFKRFQLFKAFSRNRRIQNKNKFFNPSHYQRLTFFGFKYDTISIFLIRFLKISYKRFLRPSYSYYLHKNIRSEKNKLFFDKFKFKLSTFLALYQSLNLRYFKHFFLNNSFFIRFIPTNSNFFVNFGFYDRVIFQMSAGQPIVGFTNSNRSSIPAVTNLARFFSVRLKRFIKSLFPMIFHPPFRFSRRLLRRRLKIPVYYAMEKGFDKRVKAAFHQMTVQSFWRSMGIRLYTPLPHAHKLRSSKRRRR
jgi:hypothetical protein